ncbi:MAG: nucleotide sugar dehydrogenase [Muribaculaceae bacterium]|nr:nucleotide sugar dehydrogenase [Muribaculaceae bacterium]
MCCNNQTERIGVIGLGYVGLPLACLLSSKYEVRGFDISRKRLQEIMRLHDSTHEVGEETLRRTFADGFTCSDDPETLRDCTFYIVTVPTPVNAKHEPDLEPLNMASQTIGTVISPGDVVVYESTVYPGTTEEFCIPIIEQVSGLRCNEDFVGGYSPERINPGDRVHTVENICKIVSGSSPEALERINRVYSSVIKGGTYKAPSIKVAEAAKVIENTQRDVNIAFINEVTKVFNALGINTEEVIEAASTKWNFLNFHPGLVGGHCISVDPYYLICKAELHGMNPRLITEARNVNESMGFYLSDQVVEALNRCGKPVSDANILILGFAFKKDCPDIRNTKSYDTFASLSRYGSNVVVFDPWVHPEEVAEEYGDVPLVSDFEAVKARGPYDVVVRCVDHSSFRSLPLSECVTADCIDCGIINPEVGV